MQSKEVVHTQQSSCPLPGFGFHGNIICSILRLVLVPFFPLSIYCKKLRTCSVLHPPDHVAYHLPFFLVYLLCFSSWTEKSSRLVTACLLVLRRLQSVWVTVKACLSLNLCHPTSFFKTGRVISCWSWSMWESNKISLFSFIQYMPVHVSTFVCQFMQSSPATSSFSQDWVFFCNYFK